MGITKPDNVTARMGLTSTLARDAFPAPSSVEGAPGFDRFAAAAATAGAIAQATMNENGRIERAQQLRADAEHLTADDIEAATGRRPVEATDLPGDWPGQTPAGQQPGTVPAQQFSADEISDLLRDDPKV